MPRADYNQTVAIKQGIIAALRDNLSDEFTAKEIADALLYPPDVDGRQVGATLKLMAAEGLVAKRPYQNMNIYRLHKRALSWVPPLDDSREVAAAVKAVKAQSQAKPPAAGKVNGTPVLVPPATPARRKPKTPTSKPADDHPWVHPPAVMPTIPKAAPITRPLPAHLETKADPCHSPASPDPGALDLDADDLAAMALPEAPIAPAFGTGSFLLANPPFEASSQPAVDNSNSPEILVSSLLPSESREDEPLAQPEITPAAISGCGGKGECGGHCANHAKAGDDDDLAQALERALAEIGNLTDNLEALEDRNATLIKQSGYYRSHNADLTNQLSQTQSKLADALADLATSQRERDLLHQRLREQARNEPTMMADCLMELLRLALLRIPHPDHYAGVGTMAQTSEARP